MLRSVPILSLIKINLVKANLNVGGTISKICIMKDLPSKYTQSHRNARM